MLKKTTKLLTIVLFLTTLALSPVSAQDPPQEYKLFLPIITAPPDLSILRLFYIQTSVRASYIPLIEWDNANWTHYTPIGSLNNSPDWYVLVGSYDHTARSGVLSPFNLGLAMGDQTIKPGDIINYALVDIDSTKTSSPMALPANSSNVVSQVIGVRPTPGQIMPPVRVTNANEPPGTVVVRWNSGITYERSITTVYHSHTGNVNKPSDWTIAGTAHWWEVSMLLTNLREGNHWVSIGHISPDNPRMLQFNIQSGSLRLP